jgi:PAS domain S-box-containing protein
LDRNLKDLSDRLKALEKEVARLTEELSESRRELDSAFEDPAMGMMNFSPDGNILKANDYVCRLLGYTEEELKGVHYQDITHPHDREMSYNSEKKILSGELRHDRLEKRYLNKEGDVVWVILSCSMLRDKKDRPLHYVTHIQDITARKRSEMELRQANTALQVLLDHRQEEKANQERDLLASLEKLVLPYLRKAAAMHLDWEQKALLEIAVSNLENVTSPLSNQLASLDSKLTPTELETADLIRHGRTTDEIAEILSVSPTTVAFHRRNIRHKLGLTGKKINLRSHLRRLS